MLPHPLHPAVVHFPIVFAVLLPFVVLGALAAIRRGAAPARAWIFPLALTAALLVSSFAAVRSGEAEEDRVENIVGENALHEHEEAAERFLLLTGVLLGISAFGLIRGNLGSAARLLTTAGALAVLVAGVLVGRAGGELVYEHGAAAAYTQPPSDGEQAARDDPDD